MDINDKESLERGFDHEPLTPEEKKCCEAIADDMKKGREEFKARQVWSPVVFRDGLGIGVQEEDGSVRYFNWVVLDDETGEPIGHLENNRLVRFSVEE